MSDVELANFRADLIDTMSSSTKTAKLVLFKTINLIARYIGSFGLVIVAFNILYPYLLTGSFVNLTKCIFVGIVFAAPMLIASILEKKAKSKSKNIREVCNDKLAEVDRQIATNKYLASLKASNLQNVATAENVVQTSSNSDSNHTNS